MQKLRLSNKQLYYFLFAFYNILIITKVSLEKRLQDVITSVEGSSQSSRQAPVLLYQKQACILKSLSFYNVYFRGSIQRKISSDQKP